MSRDAEIAQGILRGESVPDAGEMWQLARKPKEEKNFTLAFGSQTNT